MANTLLNRYDLVHQGVGGILVLQFFFGGGGRRVSASWGLRQGLGFRVAILFWG